MAEDASLIARYIRAVRGTAPVLRRGPEHSRFVTISRQAGAGGRSLARAIVRRFEREGEPGWTVFDADAFQQAVRRAGLISPARLAEEEVYEGPLGDWFEQLFGRSSPQDAVMLAVFRAMRDAARRGRVAFVGRGGACLLRDLGGVHVRLVASLEARARRLERRYDVGSEEARRRLREMDESRSAFFRDHLHRRIDDDALYDLVLNTDWLSTEEAAALVLQLDRARAAPR